MKSNRIRAVIADDEALARKFIRQMLKDEPDVEIIGECANGKEAVSMIRNEKPDLIFLDVQMPGLDGFALVPRLRATANPSLLIVALSASVYPIDREQAIAVGCDEFLPKPIHEPALFATFERAGVSELLTRNPGAKVGAVGFCFGGGMVWSLLAAGEPRLAAAAPFYGPLPVNPSFAGSPDGGTTRAALVEMGEWSYGLAYAEALPDGDVAVVHYAPGSDGATDLRFHRLTL